MTNVEYHSMSLDELRRYMLTHRDDRDAFEIYVDRSKNEGRMVTLDMNDPGWEQRLTDRIESGTGEMRDRD
ncbi:DUF6887 family protein [Roseofilum sp. Guam]|uniref:DUF6887 family protein n=1 Tax=Roseofilum sp. Guam TaxID=2821502 RepID=UPI001B1A7489|nr:hypothetical protein [Roseofilum sp. Guam]MBP0026830.1 hypothetical protein [Roseofilum sp. Guam]